MHRLITIPVSHYNERARWALDRFGVAYREEAYMPMLHMPAVALATWRGSDAAADSGSTRFSTPVLVTEDGRRICDSGRIVRWASDEHAAAGEGLRPDPRCEELERRFAASLGLHTRRLAYFWALTDTAGLRRLARDNVGPVQSVLFAALLPVSRRVLVRVLAIDPEHAERSRKIVLEEVAFANEALGGQRFLVADRFSAADLTLACMLAPVLLLSREEGYGAALPPLERAHPDARALAEELRETPAGRHALRMFREERRSPAARPA